MAEINDSERQQPEHSLGERLAGLEALQETFIRSEETWQEQLDGRFRSMGDRIQVQREERKEELAAVRRELETSIRDQSRAIDKAEDAQNRQNELTREDAQRARTSIESRVLALERGESTHTGASEGARQLKAAQIAVVSVLVTAGVMIIALAALVASHV